MKKIFCPQFFLPIISLLRQPARDRINSLLELEDMKAKSVDLTNFEAKIDKFKTAFTKHYGTALNQHNDAVDKIDKIIEALQAVKKVLESSDKNLKLSDKDMELLEIKKLTYGNKTVKAMLEQAAKE